MNSDPQNEYNSVVENLRHYENLLFANLAAFTAINGGLIGIIFAEHNPVSDRAFTWMCGAGVFFALVFLVNAEIYLKRFYRLLERGIELEKKFGYKQLQQMSSSFTRHHLGYWLWGAIYFVGGIYWWLTGFGH